LRGGYVTTALINRAMLIKCPLRHVDLHQGLVTGHQIRENYRSAMVFIHYLSGYLFIFREPRVNGASDYTEMGLLNSKQIMQFERE
jgi:hypothetical protein